MLENQHDHAWSMRVPFRDVDMNSNVHNSIYQAYCETAINEFLRRHSLNQHFSFDDRSWAYLVRRAELVFTRPSTFEDELLFTVRVTRLGDSSVTFGISVLGRDESAPRTTASITWVHVDTSTGTATSIPNHTRTALSAHLAE